MDVSRVLNIRIEEEMKEELEEYCAANNVTISDLIRDLIHAELQRAHKISENFHKIEGHTQQTMDRRFPALAEMILGCFEQETRTQQLLIGLSQGLIAEKYAGKLLTDEARNAMDVLAKLLKQNEEGMERTQSLSEQIRKALAEKEGRK